MERLYQLQTFGIPLKAFPVDKDGNFRVETKRWCDAYLSSGQSTRASPQSQETDDSGGSSTNHQDQVSAVGGIHETDVLFGRGRLAQYHPGNIRYREWLDQHIVEYDTHMGGDTYLTLAKSCQLTSNEIF